MSHITKNNDISELSTSIYIQNCSWRTGIHGIGEMMECAVSELNNIYNNMDKKGIKEMQNVIDTLNGGNEKLVLVETRGNLNISSSTLQDNKHDFFTIFIDENGDIIQDIPVKYVPMSVRVKNSLVQNGYEFVSQLVNMTYIELIKLRNMGNKTVKEVLGYVGKVYFKRINSTTQNGNNTHKTCIDIVDEMCSSYGGDKNVWLKDILTVKDLFLEAMEKTLVSLIYDRGFVINKVKAKIIKIIEENGGEISKVELERYFPQHLNNANILEKFLIELESISVIKIDEVMIYRQYPSIVQYVAQLKNDREREILQARLGGNTLQEIGMRYGITRERVRQIMKKSLKKKPYLKEDEYIYDHYDFSREDFMFVFNEPAETYYYLEISKNDRYNKKPLDEILNDSVIIPE